MSKRIKVVASSLAILMVLGGGCSPKKKSTKKRAGVEAQHDQDAINRSISGIHDGSPVPVFPYSQRWETMLDILEIQATGTNGTAMHKTLGGELDWWCPTMGTPFPATDQTTGSTQWVDLPGHGAELFDVPQGEPWGGFPGSTDGTWTLCLDDNGKGFAWLEEGDVQWASGTIANLPDAKRAKVSDSAFEFTTQDNVEARRDEREKLTEGG